MKTMRLPILIKALLFKWCRSSKLSVPTSANMEASSTLTISNTSTASSGSGNQLTKTDTGTAPVKDKKRKGPTGSRLKKFYRHFQQLPTDEQVINCEYIFLRCDRSEQNALNRIKLSFADFSCALVSDILLQGHLYITERHFAFYSNVFGYITKVCIAQSLRTRRDLHAITITVAV